MGTFHVLASNWMGSGVGIPPGPCEDIIERSQVDRCKLCGRDEDRFAKRQSARSSRTSRTRSAPTAVSPGNGNSSPLGVRPQAIAADRIRTGDACRCVPARPARSAPVQVSYRSPPLPRPPQLMGTLWISASAERCTASRTGRTPPVMRPAASSATCSTLGEMFGVYQ